MPSIPIRLGLQLPNFNFPGVGSDALFERLADMAVTAERSGFDSVWVMDHLHQIAGVGPPENWMLEGNTILGGLAARTSTAALGLMVGGVTYRNPALMAKITTTLDVISGGRAVLGIGAAWNEEEHLAYGFEFPPLRERFERLEDALRIVRAMFTEQRATVEGTHHRVEGAYNNPKPLRGDIPILVGGSGERKTLRLVARYADACNVFGDAEKVRHLMGVLDAHCADAGRDPAEITRTRLGTLIIDRDEQAAGRKAEPILARIPEERRSMVIAGGPERVLEQFAELRDAGLDGMIVNMPDAHDTEMVALAGETLSEAFA